METEGPFVRSRGAFRPAYLDTFDSGALEEKAARAREMLRECRACPRSCGVDRWAGSVGVCRTGRLARVSSAFPHHGEERCLRGRRGSGTIFFGWCNLRCVFCQNSELSWAGEGAAMEPAAIAALMLDLQHQACHNINLVTPEHVVPQVVEAVLLAARAGLRLPIVYNTSGYDCPESLALLEGVVDIYMPDFKFWDGEAARRLALAGDYPEHARLAVKEMHRQVGDLVVDEEGIALRGLLVRHLVLPAGNAGTDEVMRFLAREVSPDTFVNLMDQYRPAGQVERRRERYRDMGRGVTAGEFEAAESAARRAGLHRLDGVRRRQRFNW